MLSMVGIAVILTAVVLKSEFYTEYGYCSHNTVILKSAFNFTHN